MLSSDAILEYYTAPGLQRARFTQEYLLITTSAEIKKLFTRVTLCVRLNIS